MKKKAKKLFVLARFFLSFFLLTLFLSFGVFIYFAHNLPRPENFTELEFTQSTKIYDRTGKIILYDVFGEVKREIIPLEKISEYLQKAVVASEDERFYKHKGVDLKAILRAILVDLKLQQAKQGGSTITQQLIRTAYLTKQKTLARKIREIILSIELERRYSKEQILEWYLNTVYWGENCYGIEAASRTYFNKSAKDLNLSESAVLAALLPAPSRYTPYGPYRSELLEKKNVVLSKMRELGFITNQEYQKALNEKINFSEQKSPIKAPHFVFYVKRYLEEKYGENYLKERGLKVYTSLDWELQQYVEKVVKEQDEINKLKNSHNSAVVVLNPKSGEILSLVGSKDYFSNSYPEDCEENPKTKCLFEPKYDVATLGKRQPGSAFKPIVYASAFKKGYTPETILWDVKTEFNPYCDPNGNQEFNAYGQKCYHPRNYDGRYRGPVKLKQALGSSLNVPSVKVLYLAGIPETLQTAKDFGINTLTDINRYGLSLVLGGGEVNLLELTAAYGVFATEGFYIPPSGILKIEDSKGNILEEKQINPKKVLETQIARQINDILSDDNNRALVFGRNSVLHIPNYQVAVKTGTTQNLVDGWAIGYTPSVVVGVWTGNNDNSPTNDAGVGVAAPLWRKIIEKIITDSLEQKFTPPDPLLETNPILLGKLPQGDINTILFYINKDNPLGPPPSNPTSDPQYLLWQIGINNWLIENLLKDQSFQFSSLSQNNSVNLEIKKPQSEE